MDYFDAAQCELARMEAEADTLPHEKAQNLRRMIDYYRKAAPLIAADPLEHTRRVLAGVTCRAELQAFHP
jgi:hypothetical protein